MHRTGFTSPSEVISQSEIAATDHMHRILPHYSTYISHPPFAPDTWQCMPGVEGCTNRSVACLQCHVVTTIIK